MHVLGDIAEIGWALQYCRYTLDNLRWYIVSCTYSWRWSVAKWWWWKMSVLTAKTLISTHGAIWSYPGCWHQMYFHINKSTWPKCWPNVKLMLCNVTLGHQMPIQVGVCLTECQSDPKAHQMSSWPDIVLLLTTRCFYWGYVWLNVSLTQRLTNVKVTWCSTALGHQMPLLGVGLKPLKWYGTYAAVLLAFHSTPTSCFRTLCLNLPVKNQEKLS